MNGILILAHGSKKKDTENVLTLLKEKVKSKLRSENVEDAYLQFSKKDLKVGIECLLKKGVDNIKIMPMFLFDGVHVSSDIPKEIENIKKEYPKINIFLTRHIGADDRIADIIIDRVSVDE